MSSTTRPSVAGQGMVMKPEPIFAAVESLRTDASTVVLMTPQGRRFAQSIAHTFSAKEHLIIVCGHYEGVDHRVIEHLIDAEISIGDYVLTNGAIAAVVFVDAIVRLLPGVLGDEQSAVDDSFTGGSARSAAIHPAGRVPRLESSRYSPLRTPRRNRRLAPTRSRASHPREPARPSTLASSSESSVIAASPPP